MQVCNSLQLINRSKKSIVIADCFFGKMSIIPSFSGPRINIHDPFGLDSWDPFHNFPPLEGIIPKERSKLTDSHTDWKETPNAHIFKVDLPGFNKNEVKVEIDHQKVLQISGQRNKEEEVGEKNDKWHRVERSSGKFIRKYRLPENVSVDQVTAGLENGVLTVTVRKEEEKKVHGRLVEISN